MLSTRNISIKPLGIEDARAVYIGQAHKDFPSNELKSFSTIEKHMNSKRYFCCGFYEEDGEGYAEPKLRAYAYLFADDSSNMLLLDYFAVCKEVRGQGYGTLALALLKKACAAWDGIIFEVEDEDCADSEEERQIRKRRISFYEKSGVSMTEVKSFVYGVDYKLMILPVQNPKAGDRLGEKLEAIYRKMLPKKAFLENFKIKE